MQIIDDEANHNIVSWLPQGNGFTIHDKKQFEQVILPKFMKKIHYSSFTRRMNRWNFVLYNVSHTSSRYFHPQFIKGDYDSAREMTPEPQKQWRRTKDGEWETREPLASRNAERATTNQTLRDGTDAHQAPLPTIKKSNRETYYPHPSWGYHYEQDPSWMMMTHAVPSPYLPPHASPNPILVIPPHQMLYHDQFGHSFTSPPCVPYSQFHHPLAPTVAVSAPMPPSYYNYYHENDDHHKEC